MSMMKSVKENEALILTFVPKISKDHKNYYAILSALNALDNTNEIQEYFVSSLQQEFGQGQLILRLYGLLQGLFVSIDSLYALAYALTNSKNFININQNPELRQLKYIRNDVVGHPSNRVYANNELGYCLLKKDTITATNFDYIVYANNEIKNMSVDLTLILENYYAEANKLLIDIFEIYEKLSKSVKLSNIAINIYHLFNDKQNYIQEINNFKKCYLDSFSSENTVKHRLLWRVALIERLLKIKVVKADEKQLYEYCIMYEIIKINELALRLEGSKVILLNNKLPLPKSLRAFYKMLNANEKLVSCINYLHDMSHPLFRNSLERCLSVAHSKNLVEANKYLKLIRDYMLKDDSDMVYAIGILAMQYRKK